MDFAYSSAETLLQNSVQRFCRHRYSNSVRTNSEALTKEFVRENWREFGRLGWLSAAGCASDESEDLQFAPFVIAQELGRALVIEPYCACAQMVEQALLLSDDSDKTAQRLASLSSGEEIFALAHSEGRLGCGLEEVGTAAKRYEGNYRVTGHKSLVVGAPLADRFVVSARVADTSAVVDRFVLLLVSADADGLSALRYRTIDDGYAADLSFDEVQAELVAVIDDPSRFDSVIGTGMISMCAEAVGTMESVLSITREYLIARRQYGVTLSSLQALQHRMADMFLEVEMSRSILYGALFERKNGRPSDAVTAAMAAYLHICRSADFVGRNGIQLHGAMGMTENYIIGRCFKRLVMIGRLFGGPDRTAARLAARLE